MKNLISFSVMTFVLRGPSAGFVSEYSQDLMANMSAPQTSSLKAMLSSDELSRLMERKTTKGRHCWHFLAGSESL